MEPTQAVIHPWWLGLAPAETTVVCAGQTHRLRWQGGQLEALDHGDPDAERTLAALGAESCTCVDTLDAWAHHEADLRVLALASRGPTDLLFHPPAQSTQGASAAISGGFSISSSPNRARRSRPMAYMSGGPAHVFGTQARGTGKPRPEDELIDLLRLGGGLPGRLAGTVAAACTERLERPRSQRSSMRPQLQAALYGRACAAIRPWLEENNSEIRVSTIKSAERPSLTIDHQTILARLPFRWLIDVWAKGLATISGRFCLAARTVDGQVWNLVTVGPDLGAPSRINLEVTATPAANG